MTRPLSTFALVAACALAAPVAHAGPAFITVGEAAHALLLQSAPAARTLSTVRVGVDVPLRRDSPTLRRTTEAVHAVEIDEDALPALSAAVHEQLNRCGGFVRHATRAEALTTLRRLSAARAAADPQAAPSYAIDNPALVNLMLPQLQASNILSFIEQMAAFQNRRYNSSHGVAASSWLLGQWNALNPGNRRDVKVRQIAHAGWPQPSVEFTIYGTGNNAEVVVIGAHLDSINRSGAAETQRAPGADDDASGVATLTEMIRVMMVSNYVPQRTIRVIAYAAEEAGLLGSKDIVAQQAARRDKVVGVLQLDMTAYRGDAVDLWIYTDYTDAAQNTFLANLAAAYLPTLTVGYDRCGYGCSDHASWYAAGYAASLPFESSDAHYNLALHTANDTTATFGNQADHALKFARLSMAYAIELGSDGAAPAAVAALPAVRAAR